MSRKLPIFKDHPVSYDLALSSGHFRGFCHHVVDGDTADFLLDLGWMNYTYVPVRFRGVDTPETRGTTGDTRKLALQAKDFVTSCILNKPILLRSHKNKRTFDRFLADVWIRSAALKSGDFENVLEFPDSNEVWFSIAEVLRSENLTE